MNRSPGPALSQRGSKAGSPLADGRSTHSARSSPAHLDVLPRSWAAFTLVELMIVIGIIAVLAAVAMPNLREAREKAQMRACYENQRRISGAIEMYNLDLNTKVTQINPGFLTSLVTRGYLKTYPFCPNSGLTTVYTITALSGDNSAVSCTVHGTVNQ